MCVCVCVFVCSSERVYVCVHVCKTFGNKYTASKETQNGVFYMRGSAEKEREGEDF